MDYLEYGLFGLFAVCFVSATLIPFSSEGALIGFLIAGYDPVICLFVASIGNITGGITNYVIGWFGHTKSVRKRFKSRKKYGQLLTLIRKYGYWLGLITWVPILGDPLTLLLGFFKVKFLPLLTTMTVGKFARYAMIIYWWC